MKNEYKNSSMLKYGGYASVMTAVAVVLAIVVNMVASQLNIKFDLTKNKLYTLSEETVSLLKSLDTDINIYSVYAEGSELSVVTEIIDKYASYSGHIKTQTVDPYKNPQFAAKYAKSGDAVSIGSVIVDTGTTYKIITQNDLADVVTNSTTGESYIQGIKLEGVLTGTIRSLISGESKALYALTGHNEIALSEDFSKELDYSGYSLKDLNLIAEGKIPEDCEVLIINSPVEDLTQDEYNAVKAYLDNGGRMLITLGITLADTPNLNGILENYGVASSKEMVVEGNANYVYQQNAYNIIPILSSENVITKKLAESKTSALMPFTMGVTLLDTKRSTVTVEPFMSSSPYSYSINISNLTGATTSEKDGEGPFVLAASITDVDSTGNAAGTKLVVFGGATITDASVNSASNGGNYGVVMNAVDWLTDSQGNLRSKSIGAEDYLQLTQSKAIVIMAISVIVIPISIIIAGLAVVLRRKNR